MVLVAYRAERDRQTMLAECPVDPALVATITATIQEAMAA